MQSSLIDDGDSTRTAASVSTKPRYALLLALASIGAALEFYDFVIFAFFTSAIARVFFPPWQPQWIREVQTLAIFGAGYLARPLGGIVLAHVGDTRGRTRSFAVSLLLMALPTLAVGVLPGYATVGSAAPLFLLLMRIIQGIAVGGEIPGAWVFIAEHAAAKKTGLAIGLVTSGLTMGLLFGALTSIGLDAAIGQAKILQWGWRLPFLAGGGFALVTVLLRRKLAETEVFQQLRDRGRLSRELPLRVVLRDHVRSFVASSFATCLVTGSIVVVLLLTPNLLQRSSGISMRQMQWANLAAVGAASCCTILFGAAADRFGLRRVGIPGLLWLAAATYALYAAHPHTAALLLPLYIAAGIGTGVAALVPLLIVRAFPAPVRLSGVSASYNVAYAIFGGITPTVVPWLTHFDALSPAYYVAFTAVLGFTAIVLAPDHSASQARRGLDPQLADLSVARPEGKLLSDF